ncbi:MAG: Ig-like domain-containing protein [Sphingobacteriia bacterium]|nr:Ig-like domain-containing protein [Sphingobacteriia bacterium]
MKKLSLLLVFAVSTTLLCISCKKNLDSTTATINDAIMGATTVMVDSTLQLKDTIPNGTWSSSDTTIATVSSYGIVSGVKSGSVVISYLYYNSSTPVIKTDSINVVPLTTIVPITGGNNVSTGSTLQLNEPFQGGSWTTSDSTVAVISQTGLVTGVETGTCTVTYTINNAYANYTATLLLTVQ